MIPSRPLVFRPFDQDFKVTLDHVVKTNLEISFSESPVQSTSVTSRPCPAKAATKIEFFGFQSLIVESFPHDRQ